MPDASPPEPLLTAERCVRGRDPGLTAAIRCKAYGLYSILFASPHEIDVEGRLRADPVVRELRPYGLDLGALCETYLSAGLSSRRREYSGLFEVGDEGPPVAIRRQQQSPDVAGIVEDLIRFYEFFDYPLREQYAWAPDHLSVILEFCHLLCYREASAREDRSSFQLAQRDFIERHLVDWVPAFARRIDETRPGSLYADVARSMALFLASDFAWQASTVEGS